MTDKTVKTLIATKISRDVAVLCLYILFHQMSIAQMSAKVQKKGKNQVLVYGRQPNFITQNFGYYLFLCQ